MIALLPLSGKKFQNFRSWPMDYEKHYTIRTSFVGALQGSHQP